MRRHLFKRPLLEQLEERCVLAAPILYQIAISPQPPDASASANTYHVSPDGHGLPDITGLQIKGFGFDQLVGRPAVLHINEHNVALANPTVVDLGVTAGDPRGGLKALLVTGLDSVSSSLNWGSNRITVEVGGVTSNGINLALYPLGLDADHLAAGVAPEQPLVSQDFVVGIVGDGQRGSFLSTVTTVALSGPGSAVLVEQELVNGLHLLAKFHVDAAGDYSVQLSAPGGGERLTVGAPFTVYNPEPILDSVAASFTTGDSLVRVTLMGQNILNASEVGLRLSPDDDFIHIPARYDAVDDKLTAFIPPGLLLDAQGRFLPQIELVVINPGPTLGVGISDIKTLTLNLPPPELNNLSPPVAPAGSTGVTLTTDGTGFVPQSMIAWNGVSLGTPTLLPSGDLTIAVPDNLLTTAGTASVSVINPDGDVSNTATFTIGAVMTPTTAGTRIVQMSAEAIAGGDSVFLRVVAQDSFGNLSRLAPRFLWDGTDISIDSHSAQSVEVTVPASLLTRARSVPVSVVLEDGTVVAPAIVTVFNPKPTVNNPAVAAVTGEDLTDLTITGTDFVEGARFLLNDKSYRTTYVNAQTLRVETILADDIPIPPESRPLNFSVAFQVINPGPNKGPSDLGPSALAIVNPTPTISSAALSVSQVPEPGFTFADGSLTINPLDGVAVLTVTGTGFVEGVTRATAFGLTDLETTVLDATTLLVEIPLAGMAYAFPAQPIQLTNRGPGGGTSNSFLLTLSAPQPTITSVSQPFGRVTIDGAGFDDFDLVITGQNFTPYAPLQFEGARYQLLSISDTRYVIRVKDLFEAGTASIVAPGLGDDTSEPFSFVVFNRLPAIQNARVADSFIDPHVIEVTGVDFQDGAVVLWNNEVLDTTSPGFGTLRATRPQGVFAAADMVELSIRNPDGLKGDPFAFSTPRITALSPRSAVTGSGPLTVEVTGADFGPDAVVSLGGQERPTQFVSATKLFVELTADDLDVVVPAVYLASGVPLFLTVRNGQVDGFGGETLFAVTAPFPRIDHLSPASAVVGATALTVSLSGEHFDSDNTVVLFDGVEVPAAVSDTLITIVVPAELLASLSAGTVPIDVFRSYETFTLSTSANFTLLPGPVSAHVAASSTPQFVTLSTPPGQVGLGFNSVSAGGTVTVTTLYDPPSVPSDGFTFLPVSFEISAPDLAFPQAIVRLPYTDAALAESGLVEARLRLFHFDGGAWRDVTMSLDVGGNLVTGVVDSFSPFAIGVADGTTTDTLGPRITDLTLAGTKKKITSIALHFSEALDAVSANSAAYQVIAPGLDAKLNTRDDVRVALGAFYDAATQTVRLTPVKPLPLGKFYRVSVGGVADLAGNVLDQNGDGSADLFDQTFARGATLSYKDSNGDKVTLTLANGGTMVLTRGSNGEGLDLRLIDTVFGRSVLSGNVKRAAGGDGVTTLRSLSGTQGVNISKVTRAGSRFQFDEVLTNVLDAVFAANAAVGEPAT